MSQKLRLIKRGTGLGGRITSVSTKDRQEFIDFITETLTQFNLAEGLQLSIIMREKTYEVSFATPVEINL